MEISCNPTRYIIAYAIFRWDVSLVEGLPDYMKIAFEFWLKTSNELIAEAVKGKGQDMAAYIKKIADAVCTLISTH